MQLLCVRHNAICRVTVSLAQLDKTLLKITEGHPSCTPILSSQYCHELAAPLRRVIALTGWLSGSQAESAHGNPSWSAPTAACRGSCSRFSRLVLPCESTNPVVPSASACAPQGSADATSLSWVARRGEMRRRMPSSRSATTAIGSLTTKTC